jgi:hypothetical protein
MRLSMHSGYQEKGISENGRWRIKAITFKRDVEK